MNTSTSSLPEMFNSSIAVLTRPSIQTFEQYEKRGGMRDALMYVGAWALIAGLVSFVFGFLGGLTAAIIALIATVIGAVVGFLVFAFAIYFMGRQQGGSGTQDEVLYTTALYTAPLTAIAGVINAIPIINCVFFPLTLAIAIYQMYLGYLATRSSMNLDQTKAIITVVVAYVAYFIVAILLGGILAGILIAGNGNV